MSDDIDEEKVRAIGIDSEYICEGKGESDLNDRTVELLENAVELRLDCDCEPVFDADIEGLRKAKDHRDIHRLESLTLTFVQPDN